MEDLPLGRIAALVPEFAARDLPLGRTLMIFFSKSFIRNLQRWKLLKVKVTTALCNM